MHPVPRAKGPGHAGTPEEWARSCADQDLRRQHGALADELPSPLEGEGLGVMGLVGALQRTAVVQRADRFPTRRPLPPCKPLRCRRRARTAIAIAVAVLSPADKSNAPQCVAEVPAIHRADAGPKVPLR